MGSLYIGGAQCIFASFKCRDDVEVYDNVESQMSDLAKKFNVSISRYSLVNDEYSFVIMNKRVNHECFYAGSAFEYDMSVDVSDTFENRAKDFVFALQKEKDFKIFHDLDWHGPKVLYFVTS
jgi:hypothetical protein